MVLVSQRCYEVISHGLRVTAELRCHGTWPECYRWLRASFSFKSERRKVTLGCHTHVETATRNCHSAHEVWCHWDVMIHLLKAVTVHTKSDVTEMLWSICWRLSLTLWRFYSRFVLLLTNYYYYYWSLLYSAIHRSRADSLSRLNYTLWFGTVSVTVNQSIIKSLSHWVCLSVSQSICQSICQWVSQSVK